MAYSLKYKNSDGYYDEVYQPNLGLVSGEEYRTIIFDSPPIDNYLNAWLLDNGIKQ